MQSPTVWAAGEVVQEQVQIRAANPQSGSYAVWMGMCAPVTQRRAAVVAGHDRLLHDAGIDAEPIPELEFDQTANLSAEARHDRLLHNAGVDAEPISELEFDQTLG